MDVDAATALLGGLSPAAFMRRHWQKKPLLVRQAWPGVAPPLSRTALFGLAGRDGVESRLVRRASDGWQVRHGPLQRRALPALALAGWTLLVQGLDLHVDAARAMLSRFRFVPDARLDDLMVSWASPGGGVGPHVDSYDVFLLQVQGRRRWRVGRVRNPAWLDDAPLKLLRHFEPTQEWLLEPGDMLYLPPQWGHDGSAEGGDCMTCSIGMRSPSAAELTREVLLRLADDAGDAVDADATPQRGRRYRDPQQIATGSPAAVPEALLAFARAALARQMADPLALPRALGAVLSEPKARVWFEARPRHRGGRVHLDAGSRMLYDNRHVFINGEAFRASGHDAGLLHQLADARQLAAADCARLSPGAMSLLGDWLAAGWAHEESA